MTLVHRVAARFRKESLDLWAMANLRPNVTGIDGVVVWVSVGKHLRHGPRIKVMIGTRVTPQSMGGAVTVTLGDPPRVLGKLPTEVKEAVVRFVELNREPLLQHWNDEIDIFELGRLLHRV